MGSIVSYCFMIVPILRVLRVISVAEALSYRLSCA
jgi:hypothetical protein